MRLQKIFTLGEAAGPTRFCTSPEPTLAFLHARAGPLFRLACANVQLGKRSGYVTRPSDPIANVSMGVPRTAGLSLSTWKSNFKAIGRGFFLEPLPFGFELPSTV